MDVAPYMVIECRLGVRQLVELPGTSPRDLVHWLRAHGMLIRSETDFDGTLQREECPITREIIYQQIIPSPQAQE